MKKLLMHLTLLCACIMTFGMMVCAEEVRCQAGSDCKHAEDEPAATKYDVLLKIYSGDVEEGSDTVQLHPGCEFKYGNVPSDTEVTTDGAIEYRKDGDALYISLSEEATECGSVTIKFIPNACESEDCQHRGGDTPLHVLRVYCQGRDNNPDIMMTVHEGCTVDFHHVERKNYRGMTPTGWKVEGTEPSWRYKYNKRNYEEGKSYKVIVTMGEGDCEFIMQYEGNDDDDDDRSSSSSDSHKDEAPEQTAEQQQATAVTNSVASQVAEIQSQVAQAAAAGNAVDAKSFTVSIDGGKEINCLSNKVMSMVANAGAPAVSFKFVYNGIQFTTVIPAGTVLDPTIEYYGPLYLMSFFPTVYDNGAGAVPFVPGV